GDGVVRPPQAADVVALRAPLGLVALAVFLFMFIREWLRQLLLPALSPRVSQSITIVVSSLVATAAVYFFVHQREMLYRRTPDEVLQEALQGAVALLGAGSGTFYRWDPEAGLLRCAYNWRVPECDTTPDQRPGEGLAGQAFARGESLVIDDYLAWEHAMPSGI